MVIWDIYPDIFKVAGLRESYPVYRVWSWLNRHSFGKAYRLFTISDVMADALSKHVDRKRVIIEPIWSIFKGDERISSEENQFLKKHILERRFIVQCSGNIGLTHNVELLVDIAEQPQDQSHILFQIIGRGPREPHIRRLVRERKLSNVQMLPFQSDEMFPHSLSAADLGVVILNDRVSKGSVPSKAFNLMSFGVPSLYVSAADSQLARYAERYGHSRCLAHDQIEEICDFIATLASRPALLESMSKCALKAAESFRRDNADRFATAYFREKSHSA